MQFVAIGRLADGVVTAVCVNQPGDSHNTEFAQRLVGSPRLQELWRNGERRMVLNSNTTNVYALLRETGLVYVCGTTPDYPSRAVWNPEDESGAAATSPKLLRGASVISESPFAAFRTTRARVTRIVVRYLLTELRKFVEEDPAKLRRAETASPLSLSTTWRGPLRSLIARFDRLEEVDRLAQVQQQANETKDVMVGVLDKALERQALLEDVEDHTGAWRFCCSALESTLALASPSSCSSCAGHLRRSALEMHRRTRGVACQERCRYYRTVRIYPPSPSPRFIPASHRLESPLCVLCVQWLISAAIVLAILAIIYGVLAGAVWRGPYPGA